mgnify:CR=1 FL=1
MEHETSTKHENGNDANRLLCEVLSCVSKKAETPKEKYNQLKKDFENLTTDAEKMMQITIKHALKQSALVGGYSGFSKDFWIGVMSEHLAQRKKDWRSCALINKNFNYGNNKQNRNTKI